MRATTAALAAGAVVAPAATAGAASPDAPGPAARITTTRWDGAHDLRDGTWDNLRPGIDGALVLRGPGDGTTAYTDPFGDGTPVEYETGTWTSPVVATGYPVDESVTSWNATTPTGTWVEVEFRGRTADGAWTRWFVMGRWASGDDFSPARGVGDIHRTSVDGQDDDDAALSTDTYVARTGHEPEAYQTRVTLYRPAGTFRTPRLTSVGTMTNEYLPSSRYTGTSRFTLGRQVELDVPGFSQNTHRGEYPAFGGGGQVWCSPTSTTMVQYSYGRRHEVPFWELRGIDAPHGDPQVDHAAMGTWDYAYDGAGNWPFTTAYAHRYGLDSFVTRLRSLAEAERFVAAGIPLVLSVRFTTDQMPEAGYGTDGHLLVLVGFTADGDPIVNDPNKPDDAAVRSVYTRANLERVWQTSSDGLAYVIHPARVPLPPNVPGATPNW